LTKNYAGFFMAVHLSPQDRNPLVHLGMGASISLKTVISFAVREFLSCTQ